MNNLSKPLFASYSYIDLGPVRIHKWGNDKFAKGNGPIEDIAKEEYTNLINKYLEKEELKCQS